MNRGDQGERGDAGQRGIGGERGPKGDHGQPGDEGPIGARGVAGPRGRGYFALFLVTCAAFTAGLWLGERDSCIRTNGTRIEVNKRGGAKIRLLDCGGLTPDTR